MAEAPKPPSAWPMAAYYYRFNQTNNGFVDRILSAVACAGKAFHNTQDWADKASPCEHLHGASPVEWIQNAASDAAATLDAKDAKIARLREALKELVYEITHLSPVKDDGSHQEIGDDRAEARYFSAVKLVEVNR